MKELHKKLGYTLLSMLLFTLFITGVNAAVGWKNEGWAGPNFAYKACNSKTTVFDNPQYSYMSATARIGAQEDKREQSNPASNTTVHAVANSGYNETCRSWGNAY